MSLPSRRPKQKANLNWRALPIGPEEAFVLSQVDGQADLAQLELTTGFGPERLGEILERLQDLGAIEFLGAPAPPPKAAEVLAPKMVLEPIQIHERPKPKFDVRLLDEPSDLDINTRAQVLELEVGMAKLTHYELLGVEEDAEKRQIKDAFFRLISLYHVDKYFGKNLGIFRPKLERISTALTKAHDTLSRNRTRQEYDDYLLSRRETYGIRDSLPPSNVPISGVEQEGAEAAAPLPVGYSSPEVAPFRPDLQSFEARIPASDPNLKMRLLARRLGHKPLSPIPKPVPSAPSLDPATLREFVAKDMKARYDSRHSESRAQAQMYVNMAKAAEAESKWGSAINALRIALTLMPDSGEVKDLLQAVTARADRDLADKFADQARYEQRDGYYDRAARSYERAGRGKESAGQQEEAARLFHEAAACAARDGADLKKVAELARKAVTANGKKVEYRLDLARAYEGLGMRSSALGEVQRALDLDPKSEGAQALQKALR